MTVMEYLAHGWDLAIATGQPIPFSDEESADALVRAKATVPPEHQGAGMAFGTPIDVADSAPAIDRFVAFLGRRPDWRA